MVLGAFRSGKGGIQMPCDLSNVTREVVSEANMNPSVPKSPASALPTRPTLQTFTFPVTACANKGDSAVINCA